LIKGLSKALLAIFLAAYCQALAVPSEVVLKPLRATEKQCKAWVVWDEARGEPSKGARAVLDAVLTRMKKRNKTACEVVAEPKQFSGYRPFITFKIDDKILANYEAIRKLPPVVVGCDYFHAVYVSPKWARGMQKCKQVGNHIFFKEKRK
jgi:spore germination cell wall hydrolase CwlJ-like protein